MMRRGVVLVRGDGSDPRFSSSEFRPTSSAPRSRGRGCPPGSSSEERARWRPPRSLRFPRRRFPRSRRWTPSDAAGPALASAPSSFGAEPEKQRDWPGEIAELLLNGGYFRARIPSLPPFDKIVGGLAWSITASNVDVDVDLFYDDDIKMGQKLKLGESVERGFDACAAPSRFRRTRSRASTTPPSSPSCGGSSSASSPPARNSATEHARSPPFITRARRSTARSTEARARRENRIRGDGGRGASRVVRAAEGASSREGRRADRRPSPKRSIGADGVRTYARRVRRVLRRRLRRRATETKHRRWKRRPRGSPMTGAGT